MLCDHRVPATAVRAADFVAGLKEQLHSVTVPISRTEKVTARGLVQDELILRRPEEDDEAEFHRAYRATSSEYPSFALWYAEGMPFHRYIEVLQNQESGINLPAGFVPSTFLCAFVGTRIVGRVSIRHALNAALMRKGGHIGYVVLPEFRQRGYATRMLRIALGMGRTRLGLTRVLVTCDDDNIASIKTIEKNGGVLENVVTAAAITTGEPDLEKPFRRYWIAPK